MNDPYFTLEKLYRDLRLDGFEQLGNEFRRAVAEESRYEVTRYRLTREIIGKVEHHWGYFIKKWNYERPEIHDQSQT
jgi:hypothetical protein